MKRIILAAAALIASCSAALAQGTVTRIGPITSGNCASFSSPNTIQDAGFNCSGAPGAAITGLTGDGTATGPGNVPFTLATVNANVGTFGSATQCIVTTQNAKGLTTAISAVTCTPSFASITGTLPNSQLATMPADTVKCNNTGSPATPIDCTQTQLTALVNLFTSGLSGAVPASGGGTLNFLRADGTFAAPPGAATGKTLYNVTLSPYNASTTAYNVSASAGMVASSNTITGLSGLTVANVGNYIAVQCAGAPACTNSLYTTIASVTNSTTAVLSATNLSGTLTGKIAEWGVDQASAFQAAWNACLAGGDGGTVYAPHGSYFVSQLNMANTSGSCVLEGDGVDSTSLFPLQIAAYGTTHGHMFDMTGSSFIGMRNLQIGANYELAIPATAIFMAQIASNVSNRMFLSHLYVSGQFAGATFYDYGVPSLYAIQDCDFYNYSPGAGNHGVVYLTNNNAFSYTSSFATVVAPGSTSTSDIVFVQDEFHKFAGAGADNWVVRFDAATNISFVSGVISGGATAYAFYDNAVLHISYFNTTFETESQPVTPTNAHFKASGTVTDLNDVGSSYIISGAKFNPAASTSNLVTNAQ